MADEFGENEYLVLFPVGMLCHKAWREDDGRLRVEGILTAEIEGKVCLPIFTDDDLATRFMRDNGLHVNATIAWFHKPLEFADYVECLAKQDGYECVAFDPSKQKGRPIPIAEAVATLRGIGG